MDDILFATHGAAIISNSHMRNSTKKANVTHKIENKKRRRSRAVSSDVTGSQTPVKLTVDDNIRRRFSLDVTSTRRTIEYYSLLTQAESSSPMMPTNNQNALSSLRPNFSEPNMQSLDQKEIPTMTRKFSRPFIQPMNSTEYKVLANDTLTSVAAQFDTTTSELKKMNNLMGNGVIFAGQSLFVPNNWNTLSSLVSPSSTEQEHLFARWNDEMAGVMKRNNSQGANLRRRHSEVVLNPRMGRRTSIKASWIVGERPIYIEGDPAYIVEAPEESVEEDEINEINCESIERFIRINVTLIEDGVESVSGVLLVTPNSIMFEPNVSHDLVIKHGAEKYGMIVPMEMVMSLAIYHDNAAMTVKGKLRENGDPKSKVYHAKGSPVNGHSESDPIQSNQVVEALLEQLIVDDVFLHDPTTTINGTERNLDSQSCSIDPSSATSEDTQGTLDESKNSSDSSSTFSSLEIISLSSAPEDKRSFDRALDSVESTSSDKESVLYLCIRVGLPVGRKVSQTAPVEAYKKNKKPEYWFSFPGDKVDKLYAYFIQWSPDVYGNENLNGAEFVPIKEDFDGETEILEDQDHRHNPLRQLMKDWEIVSRDEIKRRSTLVEEDIMPDMLDVSSILTSEQVMQISKNLPTRSIGYSWKLCYNSERNGFSLQTLYRTVENVTTPTILVVKDSGNQIFGAVLSAAPKISEFCYGTGESYLFTFYPQYQRFPWTGQNNFFMKGNRDSFVIGSGGGSFGLWLDSDVNRGRTARCATFANAVLTACEDFFIQSLEVWAFQ